MFQSLYFRIVNLKTEDSEPNGSRHSPSSVCSWFIHDCNFALL